MRREHGFSLVEMIVPLIAAVMLVGGIILVYLMSLRSWGEGSTNVSLERTAGIVMEKIARGANGRYGLREASIGTVKVSADGHSVSYMVDKQDPPTFWYSDDVTSRYYQVGTRAYYDPNMAVAGDEVPLNRFGNVEDLTFSLSGQVLTARLLLTASAPMTTARKLSVRMQTAVFFRKRK